MVSRCFNPACSASFRYLNEGMLFLLEAEGMTSGPEPEYFWLCGRCAGAMTLALREDGRVVLAPGEPLYATGIRRQCHRRSAATKGSCCVVSAARRDPSRRQ